MTTDQVQQKRNAIEIQASLLNEQTRQAVLNVFATQLAGYMEEFLNPDMSDAQALEVRFKALGVMETLTGLGSDLRRLMEGPIQTVASRAVKKVVNEGHERWT